MSTNQQGLQGKIFIAANGHLSYEIFRASTEILTPISQLLTSQFNCTFPTPPIIGLDEVITTGWQGNIELLVGWDNWSGFYVLADSAEADTLVTEIGTYLDTIITGKEFETYIQYPY